ncbi:hypothetical protein HCG51_14630 [Tolypothrix sp. PCC 7910]|uniref:hypothetical protein n=1 Tax=Tolypothrix sp. PCC 7910 TaxID=2099387 RepID=UPI00142796CE|nr:hypothetical protein [Tolypothrix sp. PCC 7910]QIR37825.1 hypothetical protein HCG51_14630 [Tolypothrix sp. PCC 7910]
MSSYLSFRVQGDQQFESNQLSPTPQAFSLNFFRLVVKELETGGKRLETNNWSFYSVRTQQPDTTNSTQQEVEAVASTLILKVSLTKKQAILSDTRQKLSHALAYPMKTKKHLNLPDSALASKSLIAKFVKAFINKGSHLIDCIDCYDYIAHISQMLTNLIISLWLSQVRRIYLYFGIRPRYPCEKLNS